MGCGASTDGVREPNVGRSSRPLGKGETILLKPQQQQKENDDKKLQETSQKQHTADGGGVLRKRYHLPPLQVTPSKIGSTVHHGGDLVHSAFRSNRPRSASVSKLWSPGALVASSTEIDPFASGSSFPFGSNCPAPNHSFIAATTTTANGRTHTITITKNGTIPSLPESARVRRANEIGASHAPEDEKLSSDASHPPPPTFVRVASLSQNQLIKPGALTPVTRPLAVKPLSLPAVKVLASDAKPNDSTTTTTPRTIKTSPRTAFASGSFTPKVTSPTIPSHGDDPSDKSQPPPSSRPSSTTATTATGTGTGTGPITVAPHRPLVAPIRVTPPAAIESHAAFVQDKLWRIQRERELEDRLNRTTSPTQETQTRTQPQQQQQQQQQQKSPTTTTLMTTTEVKHEFTPIPNEEIPSTHQQHPPQQPYQQYQQAYPYPPHSHYYPHAAPPSYAQPRTYHPPRPDAVPIQDVETYTRLYSMYTDNVPEYRAYKAEWTAEQLKYKAERSEKGLMKSRSIYSPEPSASAVRSMSGSPEPPVIVDGVSPTGVISPIPGGHLVAADTALCLMIERSRPESVCVSPVAGYKIAYDPCPVSPSFYELGGDKSVVTPLVFPGSPNPLSPALSHRETFSPSYDPTSPPLHGFGAASRTQVTHQELSTQHHRLAVTTAPPGPGSGGQGNATATQHNRRPSSMQQQQLVHHQYHQYQQQQAQQQLAYQQQQHLSLRGQPILQGASHGLDWTRVASRLHRLAEENDSDGSSSRAMDRHSRPSFSSIHGAPPLVDPGQLPFPSQCPPLYPHHGATSPKSPSSRTLAVRSPTSDHRIASTTLQLPTIRATSGNSNNTTLANNNNNNSTATNQHAPLPPTVISMPTTSEQTPFPTHIPLSNVQPIAVET